MSDKPTCATFCGAPLRPEQQAAHDDMDAKGDYFAYTVCRSHDGQAWEVNTRMGNLYSALVGRYLDHGEAMVAGVAWLLAVPAFSVPP